MLVHNISMYVKIIKMIIILSYKAKKKKLFEIKI